ncbi:putative traf-type zinc finger family protein [Klebsormidium nitens]|uniref:Putative traf-type zinc finger family protein n=1 Tax=Klebsormidium nitens TaxID=105231 RepID=A0A1Y1HSW0_KLENI|nr:putative traf-type zinc finger family protein [Klebsormidium nitens]|eukprot:GAQ81705.1 putative traf-type zinc finger family protein [Klebsormidium nitens]
MEKLAQLLVALIFLLLLDFRQKLCVEATDECLDSFSFYVVKYFGSSSLGTLLLSPEITPNQGSVSVSACTGSRCRRGFDERKGAATIWVGYCPSMENVIESVHLLFDEEAAEEQQHMEALEAIPVFRYKGAGEAAPTFAEVAPAAGLIFSEPELGELLLSPLISRELRCPICKDVLRDPCFTVPCGHVFCHGCITESLNQGSRACPICRTVLERSNPTVRARTLDNLLSEVKIYCQNGVAYSETEKTWLREEGPSTCPEILNITDAPDHFKTCPFRLLKCQFHAEGCADVIERRHVAAHHDACEYRTVRCVCGQRVRVTTAEAHAQVCPAAIVACSHRHVGCTSEFRRGDADDHLRTCPYEALKELLSEKDAKIDALTRELEKLRVKVESGLLPRWELQWSGDTWAATRAWICTPPARRAGP